MQAGHVLVGEEDVDVVVVTDRAAHVRGSGRLGEAAGDAHLGRGPVDVPGSGVADLAGGGGLLLEGVDLVPLTPGLALAAAAHLERGGQRAGRGLGEQTEVGSEAALDGRRRLVGDGGGSARLQLQVEGVVPGQRLLVVQVDQPGAHRQAHGVGGPPGADVPVERVGPAGVRGGHQTGQLGAAGQ